MMEFRKNGRKLDEYLSKLQPFWKQKENKTTKLMK